MNKEHIKNKDIRHKTQDKSIKINTMHNFKELKVWQKGRSLVKSIYQLSLKFPSDEKFGRTNQVRRCAISICSNIAEESGRNTDKELTNFLKIARGSSFELDNLLILGHDLDIIEDISFREMESEVIEIQKMLNGLINRISRNNILS